jgi:alpha-beta hydrolase superfamily lysophospholipase
MREINYFVDNGWRVFTFDKTGSHSSEGNGTRGLPQSAMDLNAALNYINAQNWGLPILLYGHSWGGYAVTAILNFDHEITAVVSLAGYAEPLMMLQEGAILMVGAVGYLFTPFLWAYQQVLFGEYSRLCAIDGINRNPNIPVKIIHGRDDDVVSYTGAGIINQRARITNPNVVFNSRNHPNRSGHNDLTLTASLLDEINEFFQNALP